MNIWLEILIYSGIVGCVAYIVSNHDKFFPLGWEDDEGFHYGIEPHKNTVDGESIDYLADED